MQVAISSQLDDMNLSPEAYRLYCHLRCEAARNDPPSTFGGNVNEFYDNQILECGKTIMSVMHACKLPNEKGQWKQHFFELESRFLISAHITLTLQMLPHTDFVIAEPILQTVTFLPQEVWR